MKDTTFTINEVTAIPVGMTLACEELLMVSGSDIMFWLGLMTALIGISLGILTVMFLRWILRRDML